jgi:hypothetical protein
MVVSRIETWLRQHGNPEGIPRKQVECKEGVGTAVNWHGFENWLCSVLIWVCFLLC